MLLAARNSSPAATHWRARSAPRSSCCGAMRAPCAALPSRASRRGSSVRRTQHRGMRRRSPPRRRRWWRGLSRLLLRRQGSTGRVQAARAVPQACCFRLRGRDKLVGRHRRKRRRSRLRGSSGRASTWHRGRSEMAVTATSRPSSASSGWPDSATTGRRAPSHMASTSCVDEPVRQVGTASGALTSLRCGQACYLPACPP
mmetsp:Transcript_49830/g.154055  ORF Transcript_49830/g.154055 Transcript_49830/m.154055 type:complete len:200 (+) Transcript_49830:188-787(+)